jgi:hypothetical protein
VTIIHGAVKWRVAENSYPQDVRILVRTWRIVDDEEVGWLAAPERTHVVVEYLTEDGRSRQLNVGTRGYVAAAIQGLGGHPRPSDWTLLPQIVVVPDGDKATRFAAIDAVVQSGLVDKYADVRD